MRRNSKQTFLPSSLLKTTLRTYDSNSCFIEPKFFAGPNMIDFVKDMEKCSSLGIDFSGKPRAQIKAEILAKLTGEPVEKMFNFYNAKSPLDKRKDVEKLSELGLMATDNREINKAIIVNALIELRESFLES